MKLLGRDLDVRDVVARIEERLAARGIGGETGVRPPATGVEPRVDPHTFNLAALEENVDPRRPLPSTPHGLMGGLKRAFRKGCQVFINEAFARQHVFNGHVLDSYVQLSAEVIRLRRELEMLRNPPAAPSGQTAPRPRRKRPASRA